MSTKRKNSYGWTRTKVGPRTWRYRFHGPHVRKPWLVLRADGSVWGRYERRYDARLFVWLFNQRPMLESGPYRLGYVKAGKRGKKVS